MKLIKKSEKLLQETKIIEETQEQNFQIDIINMQEPMLEEQPQIGLSNNQANYIPARDNPIVLSVGKTGWQVSDIWKDIRLDNF
ncbi:hypothetical protein HUN01_00840 (plasmid) [Nostoc edaphicum CCNP1411]|uniref:Uncharacterized protein n=1 Tax=Nostoc edaphicum CCNP1411 TaxID=1472755 RepID=A0A7D7LDD3_9NOSO|nr:hypothetical protein [Nostoc edaphicum]QMS86207.1 hypothetical protein HUN01_00840 [Nostoc edaphicum CCNP1411]